MKRIIPLAAAFACGIVNAASVTPLEVNMAIAYEVLEMDSRYVPYGDTDDFPVIETVKLAWDYEHDPYFTKEEYQGKRILAITHVMKRDRLNDGTFYIQAGMPYDMRGVLYLRKGKANIEQLKEISIGETAVFQCTCRGMVNGTLVLKDCIGKAQDIDELTRAIKRERNNINAGKPKIKSEAAGYYRAAIRMIPHLTDEGLAACKASALDCTNWLKRNIRYVDGRYSENPSAGESRVKELNLI